MGKLDTAHIARINTALENAGVYYADIRMELTDHIASALEHEGFDGDIEAYIQSNKDGIQDLNDTAEAMAKRRNLKAAVAEATKPGFWLVLAGFIGLGEVLTYFTSADTAAMSIMFIAMAVLLITAYDPVFKGKKPEFSGKKHYRIIDRILVVASIGLLNFSVKTNQVHIVLAGYGFIVSISYAFFASARKQVVRYKSYYHV